MIRLFFTSAYRQLVKHAFYSTLHIFGLGLGIACFLFIFTFNSYQRSFDNFHTDADRTFVVVGDINFDKVEHSKGGSYAMFEAISSELPQVEKSALYIDGQDLTLKVGDKLYKTAGNAAYTSSAYFNIFHQPWIAGKPTDLDKPNTVALTRSLARKYFGDADAVGQTITAEGEVPLTVIGLIDERKNSDFRSDMYISLPTLSAIQAIPTNDGFFNNWGYTNSHNNIIITLQSHALKKQAEDGIHALIANHWHPDVLEYYTYKLLPLQSFHFDIDYGKGTQDTLLFILTATAVAILLMAIINYCNTISAQQIYRNPEMEIRKILGSSKRQLFMQYLLESLLVSFLALVFAFLLFYVFLQWSNHSLLAMEPVYVLAPGTLLLVGVILWFVIAILTSIYPTFFLSKFQIRSPLSMKRQRSTNWGSKALIIFQNIVAIVIIISTVVIVLQAHYLKNTDIGFTRDMVLILPLKKEILQDKTKIEHFLQDRADVHSFTFCDNPPANDKAWGGTFQFDNRMDWETWPARYAIADSAYIETFGIQLVAGRNFRNNATRPEFLINEKMAKDLGLSSVQDAIGKRLHAGGLNDEFEGNIVGVVKDFNTNALIEPISPTVIGYNEGRNKKIAIKYRGNDPLSLLADMESRWRNWYPDEIFEYSFYDEQIASLYKKENLLEKLIWIAATVSVTISSLGLIGLLSISIVKRTKEIGMRKVLGASISNIVTLLARDFLKWIVIAFVIAIPISIYALRSWLTDFAFRIELKWWMFLLGIGISLCMAALTISYQTLKAARNNPVDSLRDD